jgi:hypothetical protein
MAEIRRDARPAGAFFLKLSDPAPAVSPTASIAFEINY